MKDNTSNSNYQDHYLRLKGAVNAEYSDTLSLLQCYAGGELDPHERDDVEALLADSLEARSMLASIVKERGEAAIEAILSLLGLPALVLQGLAQRVVAAIKVLSNGGLQFVPTPAAHLVGEGEEPHFGDEAVEPKVVSVKLHADDPPVDVMVRKSLLKPGKFVLAISAGNGSESRDDMVSIEIAQPNGEFHPLGGPRIFAGREIDGCPPGVIRLVFLPSKVEICIALLADGPELA